MHNQRTLLAALAYAAHGWAVFPAPPGTKRSYKSAEHSDGRAWGMTRNAEEIRRDFTRWHDAGIGIPCGAVNGIIVVETDTVAGHGIDGSNSLAQLETKQAHCPTRYRQSVRLDRCIGTSSTLAPVSRSFRLHPNSAPE